MLHIMWHKEIHKKMGVRMVTSTSIQTGMGWLEETMRTHAECHKMLRMNNEIFLDLHDVLIERYGLQPSKHINTYEMLVIFLFICAGCESNRKGQNRFKHSSETMSRKFHKVLDCVIAMARDYLRPTDPNFCIVHKRIWNDRKAYPYFERISDKSYTRCLNIQC
jgi:hypothetical protein